MLTYTVGRQDFPKESTIKLGDDLVTNTGVWSGSLQQGVTHAVHEVIVTPEGFSLAIHSPADAFISAMQIMAIATPLRDGVLTSTTLLVRALHALAGAAWFGAMFYSLTVLHPKAQRYFKTAEEFEEFIAAISHGARWKALGACGLIGATGLALLLSDSGATPGPLSALWLALIIVKTAALLLAVLVFCYTSWRLWPARVLAIPEEVSGFQRRFRIIARVLIALTGLAFVLGILAHAVR